MIDEMNQVIISYIDDNYIENLEYDFLETLRNSIAYRGEIVVIYYGEDIARIKYIADKFCIKIYYAKKIVPVFSNRYKDIPDVLSTLDKRITHVITMDSADIWFQRPIQEIFDKSEKSISCVAEDRIFGKDKFSEDCMNMLNPEYKEELMTVLEGKTVNNSGVICGPRNEMTLLCERVYQDMINSGTEFFGIDQLYFNYEWYKLDMSKQAIISDIYNYVIISNREQYEIKNDKVYKKSGELVAVVHNAGGNWRVLERPFRNRNVDEKQYLQRNSWN